MDYLDIDVYVQGQCRCVGDPGEGWGGGGRMIDHDPFVAVKQHQTNDHSTADHAVDPHTAHYHRQ